MIVARVFRTVGSACLASAAVADARTPARAEVQPIALSDLRRVASAARERRCERAQEVPLASRWTEPRQTVMSHLAGAAGDLAAEPTALARSPVSGDFGGGLAPALAGVAMRDGTYAQHKMGAAGAASETWGPVSVIGADMRVTMTPIMGHPAWATVQVLLSTGRGGHSVCADARVPPDTPFGGHPDGLTEPSRTTPQGSPRTTCPGSAVGSRIEP